MLKGLFIILGCVMIYANAAISQPAPPGGPPVVITEIMYNSPGVGVDSLEFIELRNPSPTIERNLAGYGFISGVEYTFPPGIIVQGHEYVIIARDSVAFENTFGIQAFQWVTGSLDDTSESLILRNNLNGVIDSVVYGSTTPWPTAPNGNGSSLALCNDTLDNSLVANWSATTTNTGIMVNGVFIKATPGASCSIDNSISLNSEQEFSIFPNPTKGSFSLSTTNQFSAGSYRITLTDMLGRTVWQKEINLHPAESFNLTRPESKGTYILTIQNDVGEFLQQKLIVE